MNIALALVREVTRLPPHHEGGRHALLYQDSSLGPSTEAFGGSQVGAGRWLNRLDGLATDPIASKLHDLSSALPEQVKQIIELNLGTLGEVINRLHLRHAGEHCSCGTLGEHCGCGYRTLGEHRGCG